VRITTLLSDLLGLEYTRVRSCAFVDDGLVIEVGPTWRAPRCSGCGQNCAGYDTIKGRRWRHLDLAGMKWYLQYDTRRVDCPRCGVVVEHLPWADVGSWFTRPFEDHVGYLAQRCDKTTVKKLMRVAWTTVGDIIQRVVSRHQRGDLLEGLVNIGVDELSYRRHHEYVTVVVDHDTQRIIWAKKGKNAATLRAFFDELGPDRVAKLEAVTIDMSAAYIKAVTEASPQALIIFDRFHVQRLAHDAVDEVRRAEVREAPSPGERKSLKGTRWPLLRRAWNLNSLDVCKLATLPLANRRLFRAYLLKESLAAILDGKQVNVARRKLDEWIAWAFRSQLAPLRRLAATIRDHQEIALKRADDAAFVETRLAAERLVADPRTARALSGEAAAWLAAHPDDRMAPSTVRPAGP
jgi:transposase